MRNRFNLNTKLNKSTSSYTHVKQDANKVSGYEFLIKKSAPV
jgi:hypothetical protein